MLSMAKLLGDVSSKVWEYRWQVFEERWNEWVDNVGSTKKYLYDEEWNRQQAEAFLEGCRNIGKRAAQQVNDLVAEELAKTAANSHSPAKG